jgi:hypothetical protein
MYIEVMGKVKWDDIYMTKKPEYDKWEVWVSEFNKKAPKGLNRMLQTSNAWPWMMQERAFVTSAV